MALSEHEQRMFDELERELRGDVEAQIARARGGRWVLSIVFFVAGLAALVFAVASQLVVLGAIGFIAMLLALVFATGGFGSGSSQTARGSAGKSSPGSGSAKPAKPAKRPRSGSFFQDRWDNRER